MRSFLLRNKGTSLVEVLYMIAIFTAWILPFMLAGLWWWVIFLAIVVILFLAFEIASVLVRKKTLSKDFWSYHEAHPIKGWMIIGGTSVFFIGLALHLAFGIP